MANYSEQQSKIRAIKNQIKEIFEMIDNVFYMERLGIEIPYDKSPLPTSLRLLLVSLKNKITELKSNVTTIRKELTNLQDKLREVTDRFER